MIYLTQWLCPSRHATVGLLWDDTHETREEVLAKGEEAFEKFVVRRCGICQSENLRPEHRPTRFQTMEEAEPVWKASAKSQDLARKLFGDASFDREEVQERANREILGHDGL